MTQGVITYPNWPQPQPKYGVPKIGDAVGEPRELVGQIDAEKFNIYPFAQTSPNLLDQLKDLEIHLEQSLTPQERFAQDVTEVLDSIKALLIEKNRKYGDSALSPSRIFSKSDAVEQIKVRLDDKLTRLRNQQNDEDEDVVNDLLGYLIILLVAQKRANAE